MAIVAHTPYTGNTDCGRTNEYLCDGHGLASDRTNRYISDGHGGHTLCEGYNCPADPELATEYMHTLRLNYERQHPVSEARTKGSVTHEQIYVSPTEEDNVPPKERMQMMRELIERTPLRDFASIYVPHDNTPDKHGHISCCPYSIDGTHKLCLNNKMLNDLRREMDRICVEHGYSIVENPELWGDREYRDWFFQIKEEGTVKVHPPKDQDMSHYKQDRKRARTYSASKQSQARREEEKAAYIKRMTSGYTPEKADYYYTSPTLYNPMTPEHELHIRKIDKAGKEHSELELEAAALTAWAHQGATELYRRKIAGSGGLQKRMQTLASKAFAAHQLLQKLDIRTRAELIAHIKEVGGDIADLKQDIKRQDTIMARMADVMDNIDRWDNQKDPEAYAYLKAHRCGTPEEIADAKKRYARAVARKATNEALLQERSTEYRHLKEAETTLHPASSEELWHTYLETAFTKEIEKKIGFTDLEKLRRHMHSMGKVAGLTRDEIDTLIANAAKTARTTTWVEYRQFMRITFTMDDSGAVAAVYDEIRDAYADIRRLRHMAEDIPIIGPLTFILAIVVACYAGKECAAREREIEQLRIEAEIQKEYAREARRDRQARMQEAKEIYDEETACASEREIRAARIRFYERAAEILGRMDITMEIAQMRREGALDARIEEAVSRKLNQELGVFAPIDRQAYNGDRGR